MKKRPFPFAIWPLQKGITPDGSRAQAGVPENSASSLTELWKKHPYAQVDNNGKSLLLRRADELAGAGLIKPFSINGKQHSLIFVNNRPVFQGTLGKMSIPMFISSGLAGQEDRYSKKPTPINAYFGEAPFGYKIKATKDMQSQGIDHAWGIDPLRKKISRIHNFLLSPKAIGGTTSHMSYPEPKNGNSFWSPEVFSGPHLHIDTDNPAHHDMLRQVISQQKAGFAPAQVTDNHFPHEGGLKLLTSGKLDMAGQYHWLTTHYQPKLHEIISRVRTAAGS